eukprot:TRINITY_DN631_c0_g1_i5.p1 TRINITY_DN631_c0_g1~~TRINITY_DN631_c0_g1_i5.p1  ORF type:complete len:193 (+),score=23.02 TRINITY_DN631_c0_g1_i5:277-855(+)
MTGTSLPPATSRCISTTQHRHISTTTPARTPRRTTTPYISSISAATDLASAPSHQHHQHSCGVASPPEHSHNCTDTAICSICSIGTCASVLPHQQPSAGTQQHQHWAISTTTSAAISSSTTAPALGHQRRHISTDTFAAISSSTTAPALGHQRHHISTATSAAFRSPTPASTITHPLYHISSCHQATQCIPP